MVTRSVKVKSKVKVTVSSWVKVSGQVKGLDNCDVRGSLAAH